MITTRAPAHSAILFSANRAYFLVDMEVPSAYIDFLRAMLPDKTGADLYTMVGLQKAGKNRGFQADFGLSEGWQSGRLHRS